MTSPISLKRIATFGLFFLAVELLGVGGEHFLGQTGSLAVSFLSGLVSSASATAAAGTLAAHHQASAGTAAISTVLASIASTLVNCPILYREPQFREAAIAYLKTTGITAVTGLAVLAAVLQLSY